MAMELSGHTVSRRDLMETLGMAALPRGKEGSVLPSLFRATQSLSPSLALSPFLYLSFSLLYSAAMNKKTKFPS